MALKQVQSLVLNVVATAVDNGTGLDGKFWGIGQKPAFLSYPRPYSPSYPLAESDARLSQGNAVSTGIAQAGARAGRPGCLAGACLNLARNPRGTIQSGWSRQPRTTETLRRGHTQPRMSTRIFGMARA